MKPTPVRKLLGFSANLNLASYFRRRTSENAMLVSNPKGGRRPTSIPTFQVDGGKSGRLGEGPYGKSLSLCRGFRPSANKCEATVGAQERTRTFTAVKPLAPEASASTNSTTWA